MEGRNWHLQISIGIFVILNCTFFRDYGRECGVTGRRIGSAEIDIWRGSVIQVCHWDFQLFVFILEFLLRFSFILRFSASPFSPMIFLLLSFFRISFLMLLFSCQSNTRHQYKYGEDLKSRSFVLEIQWCDSYPTDPPGKYFLFCNE